jgi:hypothetical protein
MALLEKPSTVSILRQMHLVLKFTPYVFKIHFNIILPYAPIYPKWSLAYLASLMIHAHASFTSFYSINYPHMIICKRRELSLSLCNALHHLLIPPSQIPASSSREASIYASLYREACFASV